MWVPVCHGMPLHPWAAGERFLPAKPNQKRELSPKSTNPTPSDHQIITRRAERGEGSGLNTQQYCTAVIGPLCYLTLTSLQRKKIKGANPSARTLNEDRGKSLSMPQSSYLRLGWGAPCQSITRATQSIHHRRRPGALVKGTEGTKK
jgi:hypothetical protein